MADAKMIAIGSITTFDVKLRDVEKESASYKELVDSVAGEGIINAIAVIPTSEHAGFEYILIDGLHRLNAAADAGLEEIPAVIKDGAMTKSQVLVAQLVANSHKIETKPAQMAAQLMRISQQNPLLTKMELAGMCHRSEAFVDQYLKLNAIEDAGILQAIDDGDIKVSNAHMLAALAKVAPEELETYKQDAITLPPSEFVPKMEARIKEIKSNKVKGRGKTEAQFQVIPRPRPPKILKDLFSQPEAAMKLVEGAETIEEAVQRLLAWLVRCDTASVEEARGKFDAEKASRASARDEKSVDKAKAQYEKAAKIYQELKAQEDARASEEEEEAE